MFLILLLFYNGNYTEAVWSVCYIINIYVKYKAVWSIFYIIINIYVNYKAKFIQPYFCFWY